MTNPVLKNNLKKILFKFFKKKKLYYSMETVENWDSLNHLKLMSYLQIQFKINFKPKEVACATDEAKIFKLITKKLK